MSPLPVNSFKHVHMFIWVVATCTSNIYHCLQSVVYTGIMPERACTVLYIVMG